MDKTMTPSQAIKSLTGFDFQGIQRQTRKSIRELRQDEDPLFDIALFWVLRNRDEAFSWEAAMSTPMSEIHGYYLDEDADPFEPTTTPTNSTA